MSRSAPPPRRRPSLVGASMVAALVLAGGTGALAQGVSVDVEPVGPLPAGGTTLTVTGQGFATTGNGIYVVFGPITPAPGYYSDPSLYGAFKWVFVGGTDTPATASLAEDGSFSTTLEVTSPFTTPAGEVDCSVTTCAVITFAAHGSPDRSQDTCLPLLVGGLASSPGSPGPDASAAPMSASWAMDPCAVITGPGATGTSASPEAGTPSAAP